MKTRMWLHKYIYLKTPGETVQQLRALASFPEESGLILSIHMVADNSL